ncbi:MAG: pilus assembly protein TadG-related protein [Planctomycetota bacterium]
MSRHRLTEVDRGGRCHARCGGWARPRRGAIMIVMLLSLILLASLVFYIFNTGQHVTYRMETQNAADNAAISGAGWVARSFNTVAMNNVEMSRLIPLAAVLDSVPISVRYTLEDQQVVLQAVDDYLDNGSGLPPEVENALRDVVRPNIENQVQLLTPLNDLLNSGGYDIAAMTFYEDANGQRGQIWQSVESLAALNVATMENLGLISQLNAFRGAQIAQRDGGLSGGGLLLPWVPEVPWTQGSFDDFETVVANGRLPDDQDDPEFARGPFDTLFGMRQRGRATNGQFTNLGTDIRHRSTGGIPAPIEQQLESATIETYFTDGTYRLMIGQLARLAESRTGDLDGRPRRTSQAFFPAPSPDDVTDTDAPLAPSQWSRRVRFAANQKINRVFPSVGGGFQQLIDPMWLDDYSTAVALQEDPLIDTIRTGMWISFEFRKPANTLNGFGETELVMWGIKVVSGDQAVFRSPPEWIPVSGTQNVWRQAVPANEQPDPGEDQYYYYDLWVGVNVGDVVEVRDPYNFTSAERNDLPGPVNFTPDEFDQSEVNRRANLTFLGIAHQPKTAAFVPEGFDADRQDTKLVGLAQAQVFNNHSWDLWTQMWHAQLMPIDSYDAWMDALEEPEGLDQMPWLEPADVTAVTQYLKAVQPLADLMLEH